MINLLFILGNLRELSDEDKNKLNELLLNKKEDFNNDPTKTIISAIDEIIKAKDAKIMEEKEITDPRVIEVLDKRKASHDLFLNYEYINWICDMIKIYNITLDIQFANLEERISLIDNWYFKKVDLFFDGLYDYAVRKLSDGVDYFYEDDRVVYLYVSYNNNVYKVATHPNSELGTTCCLVNNITDEDVINFEDVKEYFTKLDKEENPTRKRNKEDE
ncbi:MAG: hypothetical protein IKX00_01870 [Bacilli bacterium]|nr:hypothetical protein [Bacilli bacterium]